MKNAEIYNKAMNLAFDAFVAKVDQYNCDHSLKVGYRITEDADGERDCWLEFNDLYDSHLVAIADALGLHVIIQQNYHYREAEGADLAKKNLTVRVFTNIFSVEG